MVAMELQVAVETVVLLLIQEGHQQEESDILEERG